jgi:hypothetical protein
MPKLIVSLDGIVIKNVTLAKNRTTLGRRPYNDIVIDNLAISGEHAVIQMTGGLAHIEDLNSTNGTNLNGKAVKREMLHNGDTIEIGKYKIRFFADSASGDEYEKTQLYRAPAPTPAAHAPAPMMAAHGNTNSAPLPPTMPASFAHRTEPGALPEYEGDAVIRVVSGAAAGREVPLTKVVTTIGKIGVSVASVTKRRGGYVVAHVEGTSRLLLNGTALGDDPVHLRDKDILELAGIQMQFAHV